MIKFCAYTTNVLKGTLRVARYRNRWKVISQTSQTFSPGFSVKTCHSKLGPCFAVLVPLNKNQRKNRRVESFEFTDAHISPTYPSSSECVHNSNPFRPFIKSYSPSKRMENLVWFRRFPQVKVVLSRRLSERVRFGIPPLHQQKLRRTQEHKKFRGARASRRISQSLPGPRSLEPVSYWSAGMWCQQSLGSSNFTSRLKWRFEWDWDLRLQSQE